MHTYNTQFYGVILKAIGDALQSPSLHLHITQEVMKRLDKNIINQYGEAVIAS
jgi:hypothetical protein